MERNPKIKWDMNDMSDQERTEYVDSLTPDDMFDFLNEVFYRFCPEMAEEIYARRHPTAEASATDC